LTAIAAMKDLPVNLWVLGESRAVPKNFFELKINDAKLDWLANGSNYSELVKEAADAAGGNAFIAEYAGTARIMDSQLWTESRYQLGLLRAATTPPAYLQQVAAQGLTMFSQLLPLLRQYIPMPQKLKDMGIPEAQFYANNAFYWQSNQADFLPFDAAGLTADIERLIVTPLKETQGLFDRHPYLTRLATFISPEEMDRDPLFIFNSDLPTLPNVRQATAHVSCGDQQYTYCEAPVRLVLPDSRALWFRRTSACGGFDRGNVDQMPSLDVAWQREEEGEGDRVADNTTLIAAAITQHNANMIQAMATGRMPVPGDPATSPNSSTGCGCSYASGGSLSGVLMVVGAGLWRRRRRRKLR
jgi:MYXO-CTERM domain-containing protein